MDIAEIENQMQINAISIIEIVIAFYYRSLSKKDFLYKYNGLNSLLKKAQDF